MLWQNVQCLNVLEKGVGLKHPKYINILTQWILVSVFNLQFETLVVKLKPEYKYEGKRMCTY